MSKSMSRKAFLGTAGLAAATALAACNSNSGTDAGSSSASTSTAKGQVYWLNFKPEIDETLQDLAKTYTEQTGVPVKVTTAASGSYEQTLTSEMDKPDAPTLFVIGNAAGVKEWGDFAMDLKGTAIQEQENDDTYDLYDDSGKLVSQGYCYECFGIVANTDLLDQAGHSVDEIKDFDSLKTVVEDIHSKAADLGFDAFAAIDLDDSSSWRVSGHLTNTDLYYESRDDGNWEETPAEIKGTYVANYKNLFDLATNNCTQAPADLVAGGHDPATEFTDGKATFFLTGSWDYATIAAAQPNTTMIPYYCGVDGEDKAGLNCGTENCWAINDNASDDDKQATMDFMVWLVTDADASAKMVEQLGIMPFKNAAASTNAYLEAAQKYTDAGNYVMSWAFNYTPNVDAWRASLVSALQQYDQDESDDNWAQVENAFVQGWAEQYKAANA